MNDQLTSPTMLGSGHFAAVAAASCCLFLAGCGSDAYYQSTPVNAQKARETLEYVMESWKEGVSIESLKEEEPAIVVEDFDWANGMQLVNYEVFGDGNKAMANFFAEVKLSLKDQQGTPSEKTVTYVVNTVPVLTVFREMH